MYVRALRLRIWKFQIKTTTMTEAEVGKNQFKIKHKHKTKQQQVNESRAITVESIFWLRRKRKWFGWATEWPSIAFKEGRVARMCVACVADVFIVSNVKCDMSCSSRWIRYRIFYVNVIFYLVYFIKDPHMYTEMRYISLIESVANYLSVVTLWLL